MSVNYKPQKTAVSGASHGKTRAFVAKDLATCGKTAFPPASYLREHNKRTSEHIHRSNVERWLVKELGESYVR